MARQTLRSLGKEANSHDLTQMITQMIKVNALEFGVCLNPYTFLEWLETIEDYFEYWHIMNDE